MKSEFEKLFNKKRQEVEEKTSRQRAITVTLTIFRHGDGDDDGDGDGAVVPGRIPSVVACLRETSMPSTNGVNN